MNMRTALVLLCLVATACGDTPGSPSRPIDRQVVLAPGQSVFITDASVSFGFKGVTGDSRCPADAICIQGGDAIVRVTVVPARGERQDYELHTGDMRPVKHGDLTIALVELAPYPFSSSPIQPGDYRATLRVTR
jgi:hypothetical protein